MLNRFSKLSAFLMIVVVAGCAVPALAESLATIQEKALKGNADAQANLGWMYYNGDGIKQNKTEGIKLWKRS